MATTPAMSQTAGTDAVSSFSTDDARWKALRAATAPPTALSTTRSGRPASTAGRLAPRGAAARERRLPCDVRGGRAAGFRPCKRCKPDEPPLAERHAALVAEAPPDRGGGEAPSLDALARCAGMSRFHFHRVFKAVTGVTPKAYAAAQRARRLRDELAQRATVTEAIYGAGFNSSGRFYAAGRRARHDAERIPRRRRRPRSASRSANARSARSWSRRPTGGLRDPARRRPRRAGARPPGPLPEGTAARRRPRLRAARGRGRRPGRGAGARLDLPLDIRGTAFQQRVWQALRAIPAGSTATYAEIAARIGRPKRCARSRRPAPPTRSPSPSPAIASCAPTARSPATAGASSARASCSSARRRRSQPASPGRLGGCRTDLNVGLARSPADDDRAARDGRPSI